MTISIDIPNELMDTPFDYISLTLCKEKGHIIKVYAPKELVKRVELEFVEGDEGKEVLVVDGCVVDNDDVWKMKIGGIE